MKVYRVEEHELEYCHGPDCKRRSHENSWRVWLWIAGAGTGYPQFCSWRCVALYAKDKAFELREAG